MNIFNFFKKEEVNQKTNTNTPPPPLNVIKNKDGEIETKGLIKVDDAGDSVRSFIGNLSNLQAQKDVITNSEYTYSYRILDQLLENAYQSSWLAKRLVDLPVELALLNGFDIELENNKDEIIFWEAWEKLDLTELIKDTQKWADVYGSCVLLLKNKNQDPIKPYTSFDNLEFIQVQYPFYNALPSPENPYETDNISFSLLGINANIKNCAVFYGTKCIKRLSPQYKYFGMSIYQNLWTPLISYDLINMALVNLGVRVSTPIYKMEGYNELLNAGKQDLVLNSLHTAELTRGISGALTMDSKSDFRIENVNITGLVEAQKRIIETFASATGYSATLILGKSPDGQNSTGKHDERNNILATMRYQKKMITQIREQIVYPLLDNLGIGRDKCKKFEFKHPAIEDIQEKAQTDAIELDNAIKLQQLVQNNEIITRYLKETNLITEEEANNLKNLGNEFNEYNNTQNETGQV